MFLTMAVVETPAVRGRERTLPPYDSTISLPTMVSTVQSPPLTRMSGFMCDDFPRVVLIENGNVVDTIQGGKNFGALTLGDDGARGAFERPHRTVAVQAYHQDIAQFPRFLEASHMTDVQQIIAAVGEDDLFAFLLVACMAGRGRSSFTFFILLIIRREL